MSKALPKILITLFLTVFIFQLFCIIFLVLAPSASQAADVKYTPQVGLDQEFQKGVTNIVPASTEFIGKYIRAIYKYAIGFVGIIAAVVLMFGGILWITAGGSAERIGEAKAWIAASLTGLILALLSYLILATINPALVNFTISGIKPAEPTAPPTAFDATIPCGQQVPGQDRICGSKCDINKSCQKVTKEFISVGARECLETLNGSGDYWLCSSLGGGGSDCCNSNNDSACKSGYICNMGVSSAQCTNSGTCTLRQGDRGGCDENLDCQVNFICDNKRCVSQNPGLDQICNNGACAPGLICAGKTWGDRGICTNGLDGKVCRKASDCPNSTNKKCSASWYSLVPGTCN